VLESANSCPRRCYTILLTCCLHACVCACAICLVLVCDVQEFVANIADLCPEYCVGSIITELLQTDSAEAQLIALRTLHLVATSVPQELATELDLQGSSVRKSSALAAGGSTSSSTVGGSSGSRRMVRVSLGLGLHTCECQPL
jgi:hypothetical protein